MTANNIPLMTATALKQTLNLTSSQRHSVAIKVGFWDYSEFGRTWVAVTGLGLTKRRFKIKVVFLSWQWHAGPEKADPILHLHLILLFFLNFNSCYLEVNFWGFKRVNKYRFCFVLRTWYSQGLLGFNVSGGMSARQDVSWTIKGCVRLWVCVWMCHVPW